MQCVRSTMDGHLSYASVLTQMSLLMESRYYMATERSRGCISLMANIEYILSEPNHNCSTLDLEPAIQVLCVYIHLRSYRRVGLSHEFQ